MTNRYELFKCDLDYQCLTLPDKVKTQLFSNTKQADLYITRSINSCIFIYNKKNWIKVKILLSPIELSLSPKLRLLQRLILGYVMHIEDINIDESILLPITLLDALNMDSNMTILILTNKDRIEIWNPDSFYEYLSTTKDDEEYEIVERLFSKLEYETPSLKELVLSNIK